MLLKDSFTPPFVHVIAGCNVNLFYFAVYETIHLKQADNFFGKLVFDNFPSVAKTAAMREEVFFQRNKIITQMRSFGSPFEVTQTFVFACVLVLVLNGSIFTFKRHSFSFFLVFQRKACETLLKLGAEVDSKDNNSRTALMWSVLKNNLQCTQVLLDFEASVDLQDTDGDSALHVACGQGHAAMVRLLLDSGACLTLCNKQGNGCLEIAAKAGSSDVAMAIVRHKRYVAVRGNVNIEYFMESACVRCLHTSCGVSEIEQVSEANE